MWAGVCGGDGLSRYLVQLKTGLTGLAGRAHGNTCGWALQVAFRWRSCHHGEHGCSRLPSPLSSGHTYLPNGFAYWQGAYLTQWTYQDCGAACLQIDKMYVVKIGEVALYRGEEKVEDPNFIHEIAGFSYFGETSINAVSKCPYTVKVASESLHFLTLPKR